jgi:cyanophycin synthetase
MIKAVHLATYWGPNPYSEDQVIVVKLEFENKLLEDVPRRLKLLAENSLPWFNFTFRENSENLQLLGEFIAKWTHCFLEQSDAEIKTCKVLKKDNSIEIILGFYHPLCSWNALCLCLKLFNEIDQYNAALIKDILNNFWKNSIHLHPDYQAQILINYAQKFSIPFRTYNSNSRTWLYGWGENSLIFFESAPLSDSSIGTRWSSDKILCKQIFAKLGAPIAPSVTVNQESDLEKAAQIIGFPCVTKPLDNCRSRGVTTQIKNLTSLINGFRLAKKNSNSPIMIEKQIEGEVYRVLVIRGKLWKVIQRSRPAVIGDGKHTVEQLTQMLIESYPVDSRINQYFKPPVVDEELLICLSDQGVNLSTVLSVGQKIHLRNIPLLSRGSIYRDVTSSVHPDIKIISEALANNFGIMSGFDYITPDITKTCFGNGAFLEINSTPGLREPLMAGIDLKDLGSTILGNKPSYLPLTLIITDKKNVPEISLIRKLFKHTGWVFSESHGIDSLELPAASNVISAFDVVVRHSSVKNLVVVCDPSELKQFGLIASQITETVLLSNPDVEKDWIEVIKKHSKKFTVIESTTCLLEKIKLG